MMEHLPVRVITGACQVYQYSSDSWTQLGEDIDGENTGDNGGVSVSLSDGTIVAGANSNDGTSTSSNDNGGMLEFINGDNLLLMMKINIIIQIVIEDLPISRCRDGRTKFTYNYY